MAMLRRLLRHEGGSSFETVALVLSVIAVFCVAGADLFHYAAKRNSAVAHFAKGVRVHASEARAGLAALRGEIDYTPTGSIIGLRRAAGVSPCTAPAK